MTTKVVVHSNTKRLIQIVGLALLIAAGLTGLKRFSTWWNAPAEQKPIADTPIAANAEKPIAPGESSLIAGQSIVVDADTIDIDGQRIRLEGIDAPEASQHCTIKGQEWACGRNAAIALETWLGERPVSCIPRDKDRYGRTLARCFVDSDDIQSWLVINGWALAFREHSKDFVAAEEVAKSRKVGLWQGEFVAPWDWRAERR